MRTAHRRTPSPRRTKNRRYVRPIPKRPSAVNILLTFAGGAFFLIIIVAICTIGNTTASPRHRTTAAVAATHSEAPSAAPLTATPTAHVSATPTAEPRLILSPSGQEKADQEKKVIKYGDKGSDVAALQKRLAELGYIGSGDVDGVFGEKTKDAMLEFQAAAKLPRTGECDHDNYLRLVAADAPRAQKRASQEEPVYVYITPKGDKYHNIWCPTLQRDQVRVKRVTLDEAISQGKERCRAKGDW